MFIRLWTLALASLEFTPDYHCKLSIHFLGEVGVFQKCIVECIIGSFFTCDHFLMYKYFFDQELGEGLQV